MFSITIISVAIMLAYAIPGFILVKTKAVKADSIPAFAKVLMYVCQPFLTIYAFQKVTFSAELMINIAIFFALALLVQGIIMFLFFIVFKKKYAQIKYRICTIATCFGNCTFIGLPLIEALLPECSEAAVYSIVFFLTMSILGWTIGSALITGDRKHMKVKKIFLNPATLSLVVALPLFFAGAVLPKQLADMTTLLGKMSTPLCMLIVGMRLGVIAIKPIFNQWIQYAAIGVKQLIFPLLAFLIVYFMPIDQNLKITFVILSACPTAAVVLSFAEMLGQGQETAANTVLLSTLTCIATIPLITLLI